MALPTEKDPVDLEILMPGISVNTTMALSVFSSVGDTFIMVDNSFNVAQGRAGRGERRRLNALKAVRLLLNRVRNN